MTEYNPGDRVEVFDGDRDRWCPGVVQQWWTAQDLADAKVPAQRVLVVKSDDEFEYDLPLTWGIPDNGLHLVRRGSP